MGKCFMIIKFTLNNTFIFLQQCQFILHSSVHSCFSQIPLNENTISFPWDITNSGLSWRFLTSSLKIEAICGLTGHFQPRGLNDASIREIVDFPCLRHFVIRPGTSVSLHKITTYSPTSSSLLQSTSVLSCLSSLLNSLFSSFSHLRHFLRSPTLTAEASPVHNLLGFAILVILKVDISGSGFTISGVAKIATPSEPDSLLC